MPAEASAPRRASRERAAGRLGDGRAGAGLRRRGPAPGRGARPPAALRLERGLGRALRRRGKRRRRPAESWAWRREGRGGRTALRAGGSGGSHSLCALSARRRPRSRIAARLGPCPPPPPPAPGGLQRQRGGSGRVRRRGGPPGQGPGTQRGGRRSMSRAAAAAAAAEGRCASTKWWCWARAGSANPP